MTTREVFHDVMRQRQNGLEARKAKIAGSKGTGWRKPIHGPAYRVDE